jgi:D-alanine-D-alanine ligase
VGEIVPEHEIFDYECKYTAGMSQEIFPAPIDEALARQMQELSLATHRVLKLRDFSRVDFGSTRRGRPRCWRRTPCPG